jgi:hypothetical protein
MAQEVIHVFWAYQSLQSCKEFGTRLWCEYSSVEKSQIKKRDSEEQYLNQGQRNVCHESLGKSVFS